ncbi:vacuolar protein sorting-associated protein 52 homolog [Mastomys coucha]|uniref:vacuolar protein sorting-associated protein 52 homolog n=1 Tax=Mastomys coucha TaxID=35658 RepID=UPI001261B937|nr:vacuolar protein sorting-associated protein 52 homolog [Mastomys coucha]
MHAAPGSVPSAVYVGMMAQVCCPSAQKVQEEIEFGASPRYIRDEYVETLSKIYLSYYRSYVGRLMKVQYEEVAEKDDLMGVEDTAKKGFFSKPSLRSRNTIFTLGTRGAVISPAELEAPILVPHTAQRGEQRVWQGYPSVARDQFPKC